MSELQSFQRRAAAKAADAQHAQIIQRACANHETAVQAMKARQFRDWQFARTQAAMAKDYVLARLPELLEQFEAKLTARGGQVRWAADAAEARAHVLEIVRRRNVHKVVKAKSMTTEEIGLNEALEGAGVEVWESDLGELICQLGGEKPYHIVTPAMHRTRGEIARLFQEKLGAPFTESAEELTMVARAHLRQTYVTADLGITGANFLLAEDGAILMTENEGNGRLSMACPPVHVAIAGIEKVLPGVAWLPLFLPLLATSGTGQQVSCYNSIVRGPRQPQEPDGPAEMIVILLDNGRSELYAQPEFRAALRCIRCGACLNACPIYRTIGGHAYGTTYSGPIGKVLTPHFRGFAEWQHLSACSTLCGACADVCPVRIDLHHLLLANRARADELGVAPRGWRWGLRAWAWVFARRARLEPLRRLGHWTQPLWRWLLPTGLRRRTPPVARQSFAELWAREPTPPPPAKDGIPPPVRIGGPK